VTDIVYTSALGDTRESLGRLYVWVSGYQCHGYIRTCARTYVISKLTIITYIKLLRTGYGRLWA